MTEPILLIDLSAIYWSCWFSSANEVVSAARQRTLAQIARLTSESPHIAICCDSGTSFRKQLFADYKSQRPTKDKQAVEELLQTKERLAQDGFPLWEAEGMEADDVIAAACKEAVRRGLSVTIATADKDLHQLVSPLVSVLSTRSGNRYDPPAVFEKFGVPPEKMRDFLALTGDTSDNIPGVPRIGQKTAAQLLMNYDSIEGVLLAASNPQTVMTPSVRAALSDETNLAALRISRELVTLNTSAVVPFDDIFKPREAKPIPVEREYSEEDPEDDFNAPAPPPADPEAAPPKPEAEKPQEVTALVRVDYEKELQPRNITQAWTLAKGIYQSRLYNKFPNVESIWAIIIRGREMGLGALTALDNFHVIDGKPVPYAYLVIARAKAHPDCEYFQCIDTTEESATWETKNRNNPSPTRLTFTFEQAKVARLVREGGGWTRNRADMCRKAGGVKLARIEYPDAALGLYAAEEVGYDGE